MASSTVNVLRYSALGLGLIYGVTHQSSLTAQSKINQEKREHEHHLNLVQKAKEQWKRKDEVPKDNGVITDPDDSRFDLETYLNMKAAE